MAVSLNTNLYSQKLITQLNRASDSASRASERLASGQRIVRASDDAAGLAVSSKLNADSRILTQAVRNVSDGISFLSIADSALTELSQITQRQSELAEQAANGPLSLSQRRALSNEANALVNEFNRIVQTTEFNGLKPLTYNGDKLAVQAGTGTSGVTSLTVGGELDRLVGTSTFTALGTVTFAANQLNLASAYFNNDGRADLISNPGDGTSKILLSNGDGTFRVSATVNGWSGSYGIGDITGDGNADFVGINTSSNTAYFYRGDGAGSFSLLRSETVGALSYSHNLGDINGDGRPDMVITAETSQISVRLGNGDGTFRFASTKTITDSASGQALGDINGDGFADVVRFGSTQQGYYLGSASGALSSFVTIPGTPGSLYGLAVVDFNLDGVCDILHKAGFNEIFMGRAGSSPAAALYFDTGYQTAGDFNGDGLLDLLAVDGGGPYNPHLALGNGDGTSRAPVTSSVNAQGDTPVLGDFNGDGVLDLAAMVSDSAVIGVLVQGSRSTSEMPYLNLTAVSGARAALSTAQSTRDRVLLELGAIGAAQSRLHTGLNVLSSQVPELKAAAARITDADIAMESARYVSANIRLQIGAALLAQANQTPAIMLKLLEGA